MERIGRRYRANRAAQDYDAIVVGSGMGGLTCAALLSKLGRKVCVLEQHYTAGGFTHSYERNGYEWDVGVHYIGETHKPHSQMRRLFDVVTDGALKWAPMDPCYDRIIIGDRRYDLVAGRENFAAELKKRFPAEAGAIDRYVALIQQVARAVPKFFAGQAMAVDLAGLGLVGRGSGFLVRLGHQHALSKRCGSHGGEPNAWEDGFARSVPRARKARLKAR